eukprot:2966228-Prymnesium_polylepis.1
MPASVQTALVSAPEASCMLAAILRMLMPRMLRAAAARTRTTTRSGALAVGFGGELWRWSVAVECGGGVWRWAVAVGCGGGVWRWSVAVACGGGVWRWAVAVGCGGGLWRW